MNTPPKASGYGDTTTFCRVLIKELLSLGFSTPDIIGMSITKALLARYGSAAAVDQLLWTRHLRWRSETLWRTRHLAKGMDHRS